MANKQNEKTNINSLFSQKNVTMLKSICWHKKKLLFWMMYFSRLLNIFQPLPKKFGLYTFYLCYIKLFLSKIKFLYFRINKILMKLLSFLFLFKYLTNSFKNKASNYLVFRIIVIHQLRDQLILVRNLFSKENLLTSISRTYLMRCKDH